jgi:hypothetical protein
MEIAGEYAPNLAHAERSLELARGLTPHELMHGTYTVMSARFQLGRWAALDSLAQEHLEALAQEPGVGCPYCRGGPVVAALAFAHRGQLDRAAELASTLTPADKPGLPEALLARYLVACGAGLELAERIVGRAVCAEENAYEVLAMPDAAVALERWDTLAAFLPQARRSASALALVGPACDRAEGLAHAAAGDRSAAEGLLRRALAGFRRMGVVLESALTTERLAAVPDGEAARLRADALALYELLGAAPHADRVRAVLPTPAGSAHPV